MTFPLKTSRPFVWIIWALVSAFYAYQYILRIMPSIMAQDIMQQCQMNSVMFGQFSGIYYIGYALAHLPLGILLDRYGPKIMMSLCILLSVAGCIPFLFASSWVYPIIGRLLIGIGSSAAILGVFKIIRMTFETKHFSRMVSLSVAIGLIGAIYGGGPVSYLQDKIGFHAVIKLLAILGLGLAAITYWIIPHFQNKTTTTVKMDVKEVLTNRSVIMTCIFAGLMVGPLEGFADVWGTLFLKESYKMNGTIASSLPSMIFIGMCIGAPVLTFIADKVRNYLTVIMASGLAMLVCFIVILSTKLQVNALTMNFLIIGICSAYQILAIYKASTFVKDHLAGFTTAMANTIIMIFGYAFHSAIGSIVNKMGGIESPKALISGLSVIPIALFIGSIGFAYLLKKEKNKAKSFLQTGG